MFDGTTHVCEALVVLRFLDDEWHVQQCVCRLMLLAKRKTGKELARQLITAVSTEVASHLVVAVMHNRADVNEVAMRTVSVLYDRLMNVGSFSHTLDHVSEKMKTPILEGFRILLFAHSPKARVMWRTLPDCLYILLPFQPHDGGVG